MKKVLMAIALYSVAGYGVAGEYTGVIQPYYYSNGLYINITGATMANRPACATRNLVRLQESDPNDPIYKNKFSMLLASYMAGKKIYLRGTDQCTAEGDEIIFMVSPLAQ